MPLNRKATAEWKGDLKTGKGTFSAASGAFKDLHYSWGRRFADEPGTNPEELIAAAHASCFSMAFSAELGKANLKPDYVRTECNVVFDKTDKGFAIIESRLTTHVKVPGGAKAAIEKAGNDAKAGCPISRALNTKISLTLTID
jgi:osmotically inducible protein OsmC